MSESTNEPTTTPLAGDGQQQTTTPPAQPTLEDLQREVEKWKHLSRQNERNYNEARTELAKLREASMTEAEKALEQAKEQARSAALAEVGTRLVESELRAAAVTAGVQLPPFEFINTAPLVGSDGLPNSEQIKAFVESLPKPATGPEYSQDLGLGRQGSALAGQLRRADLANMTPAEIVKARNEGRLDALMRGEI